MGRKVWKCNFCGRWFGMNETCWRDECGYDSRLHDTSWQCSDENVTTSYSSSCFIATAAYGTPLANEIKLLRKFRDERLSQFPLGRAFIAAYYRLGPAAAKLVERSNALRALIRAGLRPIIHLLKD